MEFDEYAQYRETKPHKQPDFAYNTYLCTIPQDFDRVHPHWHEQMEVIYVKRGSGVVSVDFDRLDVRAGSIVPVLPGEIHSIEGTPGERMEYENIIFSLGMLGGGDGDTWFRLNVLEPLREGRLTFMRPIPPGTDFYVEASAALDGADLACTDRQAGYSLLVKSSLLGLLHALYVHRLDESQVRPRRSTERLKTVLADVKVHYGEKISIADAARLAGYSESHFMRMFKEETGQTFVAYLTGYRLSAAGYLLRETSEPIGSIALSCGFDNFSYFTRTFRAHYGVTPSKFRTGA